MKHPTHGRALDRDRFLMFPRDDAARGAHQALERLNRLTNEELAAAISLLFAAVTHRCGISPEEAYRIGYRMMAEREAHHSKANTQIQALRDFAGIQGLGLPVDDGTKPNGVTVY